MGATFMAPRGEPWLHVRHDVPLGRQILAYFAATRAAKTMTGWLTAALLANMADLVTYLRASPAVVAADETNPLPHLMGQVAGGVVAKLFLVAAMAVIVIAFRSRPRTRNALLAVYTVAGAFGAIVNTMVGG
jgi:hypothetical protein